MNAISSIQLQRLVDGELDFEQTLQILRLAENDPASWRLIASTFVENQIWHAGFAAQLSEEFRDRWPAQTMNHEVLKPTGKPGLRMRWLSLAASIVLAGFIGFLAGHEGLLPGLNPVRVAENSRHSSGATGNSVDAVAGDVAHSSRAQSDGGVNAAETSPAVYRMQLEDPQGNQFMDSEIPLYPVRQQNDLHHLRDMPIPESLRQRAQDSGYQIDQKIRYLSGRMNDGRQFVIPVRDYRLMPRQ